MAGGELTTILSCAQIRSEAQPVGFDQADLGCGQQVGGGERIRTDDRLVANQVLYQLSYAAKDAELRDVRFKSR